MKRPITSFFIRAYLNHEFKRLGHMTSLIIDSANKSLALTADLAGEKEPIDVRVRYRIEEEEGRLYFIPQDVDCSREWINVLADQFLASQPAKVEIPHGLAAAVVKMLRI